MIHDVRTGVKKSLGQNFLKNESTARELADAADVGRGDTVVEVGPGRGMITKILLERAERVIAVEKDETLAAELTHALAAETAAQKLVVVPADILQFEPKNHSLQTTHYKLIGSIPYYITGAFLRRFLSIDPKPRMIAVIVQKEVAERIIAKNGKESLLSISVKAYGAPKYVKTVKAGSFVPAPKVDSAILTIAGISRDFFEDISEDAFFSVVRAGFAHPRKKLSNNLRNKGADGPLFKKAGVSPDARAEDLSLEDWKRLARVLARPFSST
ncbi:MAG: ribosomal RNA small subunit methyltransferase A [Parcubacteria group bacterium]|nr:ribosomal RNA small subunit methyltransferase A [Parcubacteria group bacterium]